MWYPADGWSERVGVEGTSSVEASGMSERSDDASPAEAVAVVMPTRSGVETFPVMDTGSDVTASPVISKEDKDSTMVSRF